LTLNPAVADSIRHILPDRRGKLSWTRRLPGRLIIESLVNTSDATLQRRRVRILVDRTRCPSGWRVFLGEKLGDRTPAGRRPLGCQASLAIAGRLSGEGRHGFGVPARSHNRTIDIVTIIARWAHRDRGLIQRRLASQLRGRPTPARPAPRWVAPAFQRGATPPDWSAAFTPATGSSTGSCRVQIPSTFTSDCAFVSAGYSSA
jgi:hypothetical protein